MVLEGLESQAKVTKQMKTDYLKHLVAAICLLLGTTALYAHDVEIGGIYYNLITKIKQATVTYKGEDSYSRAYSGSVTIPSTIESGGVTYTVTSIGDNAFYGCCVSACKRVLGWRLAVSKLVGVSVVEIVG